jgi:hypothetical protein
MEREEGAEEEMGRLSKWSLFSLRNRKKKTETTAIQERSKREEGRGPEK